MALIARRPLGGGLLIALRDQGKAGLHCVLHKAQPSALGPAVHIRLASRNRGKNLSPAKGGLRVSRLSVAYASAGGMACLLVGKDYGTRAKCMKTTFNVSFMQRPTTLL